MTRRDEALERLRGERAAAQLAGSSGRMLVAEGRMRPVIGLREGLMRGRALVFQIAERLEGERFRPIAPETLNPVDLERIDLAMVERALATLEPSTEEGAKPPLVFLPMSWPTARAPRSRKRVLRLVGEAQARLRILPLCEVYGIERGTPPSALREAAGALQPIFRGVLPKVSPGASAAHVIDCGFTGAAVDAGDLTEGDDEQAMLRQVLALQRVGPGVLFHGVRSVAALAAARGAGASWASLDIVPGALGAKLAEAAQGEAQTQTAARSPEPPSEGKAFYVPQS